MWLWFGGGAGKQPAALLGAPMCVVDHFGPGILQEARTQRGPKFGPLRCGYDPVLLLVSRLV
jgi:hypothetical protein